MKSPVSCRQICAQNHVQVLYSAEVLNGWQDSDFIQIVRQNTIKSWDYMNSLWNKWIIDTTYCASSGVNLNKAGASFMERKYHQRYYINILVSGYLWLNWQEHIAIDKAGSQLMERKRYRQVLSIFQITLPQIFKIARIRTLILAWHLKRNVTTCFQIRSRIIYFHISWVRTWFIFCFFSYVSIINLLWRVEGVGI